MKECRIVIEKVEVEKSDAVNDTASKNGHKKKLRESWGKEKVKCDECGKILSKAYLLDHRRNNHGGEKPFVCTVADCNQTFSRRFKLVDHKRLAHGYPKLKCKVKDCDSEFAVYNELRKHHTSHQSMVDCAECGKRVSQAYLFNHIRYVHKGIRPAGCEISGCGKKFINKAGLADHMRSVHGFAKLKCTAEACSVEFTSSKSLLQHQKTFHG